MESASEGEGSAGCQVWILTFGSVVNIAGPELNNASAQAAPWSEICEGDQQAAGTLEHSLNGHECLFLKKCSDGLIEPHDDCPPSFCILPVTDSHPYFSTHRKLSWVNLCRE